MNLRTQLSAPAALSVTGLGKAFGDTVVLDGIAAVHAVTMPDPAHPAANQSRCCVLWPQQDLPGLESALEPAMPQLSQ